MMTATVNLQLDEKLIDLARDYAIAHGQSLSQLMEDYLRKLVIQTNKGEVKKDELTIAQKKRLVRKIQSYAAHIPKEVSLADELIAERRLEALKELE